MLQPFMTRATHNSECRGFLASSGSAFFGDPDAAKPKQSWYDELVRIPDFIACSLAAWDYRSNLVPGRPKYAEILHRHRG
jgi:hypothetical protein